MRDCDEFNSHLIDTVWVLEKKYWRFQEEAIIKIKFEKF